MRRISWLIAIPTFLALPACSSLWATDDTEAPAIVPAAAQPPAAAPAAPAAQAPAAQAPAAPAAPAGVTYRCDMISGTGTCQEFANVESDMVEVDRAMCAGQFTAGACPSEHVESRCTVGGMLSYVLFSYSEAGGAPVALTAERLRDNCSFLSGQLAMGPR